MLSKPLSELLEKDSVFVWTTTQDDAFVALKKAPSSAFVLALSDFSRPFHIETDVCSTGVGAALQHEGHPIAYISKALGPRNPGLSTY